MDIFAAFHRRTVAILADMVAGGALPAGLDPRRFAVRPPRDPAHGDLVIDAALVYATASGGGACALAVALASRLAEDGDVAAAVVAGPGFVDLVLRPQFLTRILSVALEQGDAFGVGPRRAAPPEAAGAIPLRRARRMLIDEVATRLSHLAETGARDGCGPVGPVRLTPGGTVDPTLADLVADVGRDAACFALVSRRADAALDLDLARMVDRSCADPLFHIRYAHARGCAVLRRAAAACPAIELSPSALAGADFQRLSDPCEIAVARQVARYPGVLRAAAEARAPHRIALLLSDLAEAVHLRWKRSKDQPQLRFVNEEERELTTARLGLVTASTIVLKSGLGILGVTAPDEMR